MNFNNRLEHAEHKIFCSCMSVYKFYEINGFTKSYEVLSTLKK